VASATKMRVAAPGVMAGVHPALKIFAPRSES
jgi:hypothetical protein